MDPLVVGVIFVFIAVVLAVGWHYAQRGGHDDEEPTLNTRGTDE